MGRMLIAAVIVGLIVAYHLGLKLGMYAAAGAGGLFLVAMVVPHWATYAYAIVGVAVIGVCLIGPKLPKQERNDLQGKAFTVGRRAFSWLRKQIP